MTERDDTPEPAASPPLPAASPRETWAVVASAHALLLMTGLVYFKTAKLVGVAGKAKVPVGTGLLAYAQDLALCLVWLALLIAVGRVVAARRPLRWATLGAVALVETAIFFYAMFNVHYFTLFGIPLNLEAMSDVEHVGEFWSTVQRYLASWHTVAATLLSALAFLAPWLLSRARIGRALRLLVRPLAGLARGWRAPIVAGSGLSAIVLVPIDQFELAKNDVIEMVQSAARVGMEREAVEEEFVEGTNRPPPSFHEPDGIIEPTQELRDLRQRIRWANRDKPMNVVFIVLESMVSPDVARQLGVDEALPYTRKLAKRSVVLEDYSTVFPLSMKSLITLTCSILPSPERLTLTKINPQLDCRSVMETATEKGYRAGLFHSGRFSFTLKNLYFEDRGFDTMVDANDLEQADPNASSDYWGIQEEATIDRMFEWIDESEKQSPGRPFFALYIPVAGHFPYVPLNEEFQDRYGTETKVQQYKNAMAYTDAMVKKTMEGFRERNLVNDTLFVIVGDHGLPLEIHPNNNTQSAETYEENVRTLAYIYQPKHIKKKIVYPEIVQHFDMLPSIYDLLGWEIPQRYAGDSIFSTRPKKMAIHYTIRSKELAALRDGDIKVILDRRTGQTRVYDLAADPGESEDVREQHEAFADHAAEFFDSFIPAHAKYIAQYPAKGRLEDLAMLHERIDAAPPPTLAREQALDQAAQAMQPDTRAGYEKAEQLLLSAAQADRRDFDALLMLMRVYDRRAVLTDPGTHGGSWSERVIAGGDDDEVLARKLRAALRGSFDDPQLQRRLDATLLWGNARGPNSKSETNVNTLLAAHAADPEDPEIWAFAAQLVDDHRSRRLLLETEFPLEDVLEKLHAYVIEHPENWFVGSRLFRLYAGFLSDEETAFSLYSPETALASKNPTMLAHVGIACYDFGRVGDALALLEEATRVSRKIRFKAALGDYYARAGAAALLLGDQDKAQLYFNAAHEYDDRQTRASAGLAILAAWRGDEGELVRWLESARNHRSGAPKWAWSADAELAALWRLKTKMRKHYIRAGSGDMIIDESRFHTAMHLGDWIVAERTLRNLVRENPFEQARYERYARMSRELAAVHRDSRLPKTVEGLEKQHRGYHAERQAWLRVFRASKAGLSRRTKRLGEQYYEQYPAGVHTGAVRRLLDPDAPDEPPKRAAKRDPGDDEAGGDEHEPEHDEPEHDEDEDEEHDDGG